MTSGKKEKILREFLEWMDSRNYRISTSDRELAGENVISDYLSPPRPPPRAPAAYIIVDASCGGKEACDCVCHHVEGALDAHRLPGFDSCRWCHHSVGSAPFKLGARVRLRPTAGEAASGKAPRIGTVTEATGVDNYECYRAEPWRYAVTLDGVSGRRIGPTVAVPTARIELLNLIEKIGDLA